MKKSVACIHTNKNQLEDITEGKALYKRQQNDKTPINLIRPVQDLYKKQL